jgi:hypothetical protein
MFVAVLYACPVIYFLLDNIDLQHCIAFLCLLAHQVVQQLPPISRLCVGFPGNHQHISMVCISGAVTSAVLRVYSGPALTAAG